MTEYFLCIYKVAPCFPLANVMFFKVLGSAFVQLSIEAGVVTLLLTLGFGLAGYVAAVVISTLVSCVWMGVGLKKKLSGLPATGGTAAVIAGKHPGGAGAPQGRQGAHYPFMHEVWFAKEGCRRMSACSIAGRGTAWS